MSSRLSVREQGRSRSKSPSGRDRPRSGADGYDERSATKRESEYRRSSKRYSESSSSGSSSEDKHRRSSKTSSKKYYESDSDDDPRKRRSSKKHDDSGSADDRQRSSRSKREEKPSRRRHDTESEDDIPSGHSKKSMGAAIVPYQKPLMSSQANPYAPNGPHGHTPQPPGAFPEQRPHETRHTSYVGHDPRYAPPPAAQNSYTPRSEHDARPRATSNVGQQYANVGQVQYAQMPSGIAYKYGDTKPHVSQYETNHQVVNVDPRRSDSSVTGKYRPQERKPEEYERERKRPEPSRGDDKAAARRLSRLSVGGAAGAATLGVAAAVSHSGSNGHGKPPASPLLEAYTGTYQTISPMPSPLALAEQKDDSDISDVDLESEDSGISDSDPNADIKRQIRLLEKQKKYHQKMKEKEDKKKEKVELKEYERQRPHKPQFEVREPDDEFELSVKSPKSTRKSVSWYDAEKDAVEIAAVLKGSRTPDVKPLIKIIPHLNVNELDALKAEYKNHATIQGQGINMSKHIKARVGGYLGKAVHACSLGQYESDAYWANCFYQSGASRRELLIESLMGRTNQQIREIKNFFKDKKYDDDLEKCMKAELKADKFRTAILLALEERRMADSPVVDPRLVRDDVEDLYDALHSAGGESAMIKIIVVRSDAHLREIMRMYEKLHGQNFAREMISKSKNLVVSVGFSCKISFLTCNRAKLWRTS